MVITKKKSLRKSVVKTAKKEGSVKDKKVQIAKGVKVPRGKESKIRKRAGSGSVGKYKNVGTGDFCGESGGSNKYSYPVNSKKRCHAALAYARNAPNPEGIKKCVYKKCAGEFKSRTKTGKKIVTKK